MCGLSWFKVKLITNLTGVAGADVDIYDKGRIEICHDLKMITNFKNNKY